VGRSNRRWTTGEISLFVVRHALSDAKGESANFFGEEITACLHLSPPLAWAAVLFRPCFLSGCAPKSSDPHPVGRT
jgi:hypothetical protein